MASIAKVFRKAHIRHGKKKGKARNLEVSFSALRKDVANVLDFMERLKNEEDQKSVDVDLIEKLKLKLTFICTYVQLPYSDLEQFEDTMTRKRQEVENLIRTILDNVDNNFRCKYSMHHVILSLFNNMDDCISLHHHSKSNETMMDEQLDFLLLNIHHLSKYHAEKMMFPLVTQYEILQNVCGSIRDFHGLIVDGCIKHDMVENVLPLFQRMAERVGCFLWEDQIDEDSQLSELDEDDYPDENFIPFELDEEDQTDEDSRLLKLVHLLLEIVPIELEVMHKCYTNLKSSTSAEVGRFIKQLLETSPDILRECLIHLQEHMVIVITASTPGARNIHVMMEFLLIILTDVPGDLIHPDKLFDVLAHVGLLTREVLSLVRGLEEKSMKKESTNETTLVRYIEKKLRNKESTDETNRATLKLLENIKLLKEYLKHVCLKAPNSSQCCFPMSDGQIFMHLLHIHLNDLLDSNAYSVALIKEEIALVKQDLEFIRSSFVNVEQGSYKDLWARVLDVAYEAKDVIDSIIVRDNGLLHLIFSLPISIRKIKLIKENISNLLEKIPNNKSLIVVNTPKKPVESKSLTTGKIIVGFEEETKLIIENLTSRLLNLDVISITGMPGSGKTTLAYKVFNDERISTYFDLRAWCTVGQEYDEKKLLDTIFNQVNGSNSRLSENIDDTFDALRKQLFRKRYLIVLDDVWDTTTWDKLTRPFKEGAKGSRIILTTREKKVALHGKRNTDPLDLRLLRPEESWELLEKRAFGNKSCPDDLLDVGKEIAQNCKGLPLVADLIAGVIAGREKKKTVWLEVLNNLNSFILNSEVEVMKVIELSYDHLPDQVKPCLLCLASYSKDTAMPTSLLIDFLHPEGLVEQTEMKVYLDNLFSSSLVILFNEMGEIPTLQLHDLVHDFCLIKARKEKLFDVISSSAPSSSSDLMPRIVTIDYNREFFGLNNFVLFSSNKKRHSGKLLYSLRINGDELDDSLFDTKAFRHLRLLRVLYLDPSFIKVKDSLLNEICMLNHLRFLYIGTKVKSLPASLSNLWNLETLWLVNHRTTLVLLPRIWDLVKLRSLSICDCCFFDLDADESVLLAKDTKLEKLRNLEKLVLSYSKDTEKIFKRFPNLQELAFVLKESSDYSTEQHWFPKLDFLTELEELSVEFESSNTNDTGSSVVKNWSWDFHFPLNLKRLHMVHFPLTSDALSTVVRLPNLEELSLFYTIIEGGEWNIEEEDIFQKLKYLNLRKVTLARWEFVETSFPNLEKLELWGCRKLEEIPRSFGDVCSLKVIKLVESPHLKESATNIKKYVVGMGMCEFLVVGENNSPLSN